jgi:hypothetical protein
MRAIAPADAQPIGLALSAVELSYGITPPAFTITKSDVAMSNMDFDTWASDNPSSWLVEGESSGNPVVTERNSGTGYATPKTSGGALCFYSSANANLLRIYQSGPQLGNFYEYEFNLSYCGAGSLALENGVIFPSQSVVGTKIATYIQAHANLFILRAFVGAGNNRDLTCDYARVRLLSGTDWINDTPHAVGYGDFSISPVISNTAQAGVIFSHTDADNYGRLVVCRHTNRLWLFKKVAGVTTFIGSYAGTYSSGKAVIARVRQNGNLDVVYGTTTLASNLVTGIPMGLRGGACLTNASNQILSYNWDARNPI